MDNSINKSELRKVRVEKGLTQLELGMRTGINPSYISKFETGYTSPWKKARKLLADELGKQESELFPEWVNR